MSKKLSEGVVLLLDAASNELRIWNEVRSNQKVLILQGRDGIKRVIQHKDRQKELERIRRLTRRKHIKLIQEGDKLVCSITKKGSSSLIRGKIRSASNLPEGMYLYAIFDIPEELSSVRKSLRNFLRSSGFKLFQKSVWKTGKNISKELSEWAEIHNHKKWLVIILGQEL